MVLAHHTLEESISASSHVTVPLVRDQRLIGLVVSLTALSDALLRVAGENRNMIAPAEEAQAAGLEPLPKYPESTVMIRMARLEWRRAVYLASIISNPTYRNEMLYRVAEDESIGSSSSGQRPPCQPGHQLAGQPSAVEPRRRGRADSGDTDSPDCPALLWRGPAARAGPGPRGESSDAPPACSARGGYALSAPGHAGAEARRIRQWHRGGGRRDVRQAGR